MATKDLMGLLAVLWLALGTTAAVADDAADAQETVDQALATLERFVADPDIPWFHRNLKNAKGLLIVPRLIKGGFLVGGSGGTGVLLARTGPRANGARPRSTRSARSASACRSAPRWPRWR